MGQGTPEKKVSIKDVMMMNRKSRRRLGKINGGVKFPAMVQPFVRKQWEEEKTLETN